VGKAMTPAALLFSRRDT